MDIRINGFGYSEMYEWLNGGPDFIEINPATGYKLEHPIHPYGRFVQFANDAEDEKNKKKITVLKDLKYYAGVTTVNSKIDSDNPDEWSLAQIANEYGDSFVKKEKLAIGECVYEQNNEMQILRTRPYEHYVAIENPDYDKNKKYVKRSDRKEWIRVNIMGKCVVEDNGDCKPGEFCKPYLGKLIEMHGKAIPAFDTDAVKFYVLERVSNHTIMIINKPIMI